MDNSCNVNENYIFESLLKYLTEENFKKTKTAFEKEIKKKNLDTTSADKISSTSNVVPSVVEVYSHYYSTMPGSQKLKTCNETDAASEFVLKDEKITVEVGKSKKRQRADKSEKEKASSLGGLEGGHKKVKHDKGEEDKGEEDKGEEDKGEEDKGEEDKGEDTAISGKVNGVVEGIVKKKKKRKIVADESEVMGLCVGKDNDTLDCPSMKVCVDGDEKKKTKKETKEDTHANRFQRVDSAKWTAKISKHELCDNSFNNKTGDNFAGKAAQELIKVRGKDFRHEKSKKKRASWKGCGSIDLGVNSVQFDDSDEE